MSVYNKRRLLRYCTVHIIRNIRASQKTERDFPDQLIWRLQNSSSAAEYAQNMTLFKYPKIKAYLREIEPRRWIRYAMIEAGASTFGWRSNNIGEIGQGSILGQLRGQHPLQFFSELQINVYNKLSELAKSHAVWEAQSNSQPVAGLVPHGIKVFNEHVHAAASCTVKSIGSAYQVTYQGDTGRTHPPRIVNMSKKECSCLTWQDLKFPCKCAIAVATKLGTAANLFVASEADQSYKIKSAELKQIIRGPPELVPIIAPTPDQIAYSSDVEMQSAVQHMIDELDDTIPSLMNSDGTTLQLIPKLVNGPPKRQFESHGNRKRKRKTCGSSASTGRTKTRSFAATEAGMKRKRTGACATCTRAGRVNVEPHKSKMCPFALPDVESSTILTISDTDEN